MPGSAGGLAGLALFHDKRDRFNQLHRIDIDLPAKVDHLDHVEPPLPGLYLRDVGLGPN
jgi:hypothetical protein